ncbi:hypothetical protein BH10PSE6_BH10PSE6_01570 [soil metagenome]
MKSTILHKLRTSALATLIALAACLPQASQSKNAGENQAATEPPSAQPRSGTAIDSFHLPRDLEIELAMSALPPHLKQQATIYVLNPAKGFEVARKGTNGFHAFVARTGDDAFHGSWELTEYSQDVIYPVSFDDAGSKANMKVFFDAAELQAKGTPPAELKRLIQQRYKTGYYKPPERAGVSYMMQPMTRTYDNPVKSNKIETWNGPHVMYLAPNASNQDIGGAEPGIATLPFIIQEGPHGFIVQHVGEKERAEITREHAPMLKRLCELNPIWCLPKSAHGHSR